MKQRCLGCMAEYESEYGLCPYCGYEPSMQADNPLHLKPGTQLTDRYTVGRVLGFGGFGVTYIAFDSLLNQRVAIKEYLPSEFATRMAGNSQVSVFGGNKAEQFADGLLKFVDEAKRLAKFQGEEGIVRVFDSFEANQTAYIVMEYLEGETLTAYLEREGKVSSEQAVSWLESVVYSLEVIHQAGIIHRDIAPDNIFLTSDGRVKLIDFGAARYATTSHSRSLTVIIKPGYSPEEQYRSRGDQGPHTDVYALAAVLYRMVTGVTPPDALERRATLETRKKDILFPPSKYCEIDDSLENAILNAMNVRIEDRTATAQEFWAELTSGQPVKRRGNQVKALDLARWPLGLKIGVPVLGMSAIALLVLLLTGVIGPKAISAGNIEIGEGMTRVPGVINYSIGVAQEMLEQQQLTPVIGGRRQSDVIPPDMVLAQSVDAGQVVEVNSRVELYISEQLGIQPEDGYAPEVLYYTEKEAVELFRQQGIEPKLEYIYSSDVAEDLVIAQSVMGGDVMPENAEVVLTISLGPDPNQEPADSEGPQASDAMRPLRLNRSSLSLYVGDSVMLTASGGAGNYQWSSSTGSVATVRNGVVTAAGAGRAVITVSSGTETVSCPVTVRDYSLTMSQTSLSMTKGESIQLSVSGAPAGIMTFAWSSSNTAVAAVHDGQVTAMGAGNAIITAEMPYGKTYSTTCFVNVTEEKVVETTSVTVSPTPTPMPTPESNLTNSNSTLNMRIGDTATLSSSGQSVIWGSSDTSVVTISSGGVVTAVGAGEATITAQITYNGRVLVNTSFCKITVLDPGGSVKVTPASLELQVGETKYLMAVRTPDGQSVTWNSYDPSIATVSSMGQVTAVKAGMTTITASMPYNGKAYMDTCQVTVTAPTSTPVPTPTSAPTPTITEMEGSVKLSSASMSLESGGTGTLSVATMPSGQSVTWSSSDTSVAKVDNGQVTAAGTGTATITALMTYGGKTYSSDCTIQVSPAQKRLSSITVKASSISLAVGSSITVMATANYQNAPSEDITSTANFYPYTEGVAVCSGNTVTGIAEGTVLIMAEYQNFAGYIRIYVNAP